MPIWRQWLLSKVERLSEDNWQQWEPTNHWIAEEYLKQIEEEGLPLPAVGGGCIRGGPLDSSEDFVTIWFADRSGMSVLCVRCWDELGTTEERLRWIRSMWWRWEMSNRYNGCPKGSHTDGAPPFQRGHTATTWQDAEMSVRLDRREPVHVGLYGEAP